jgi:hypothetical protein
LIQVAKKHQKGPTQTGMRRKQEPVIEFNHEVRLFFLKTQFRDMNDVIQFEIG